MKLLIALHLLVLGLHLPTNAQSKRQLDEKNGFKEFKLGDTFMKWEGSLLFQGAYDDGDKAYLYTGKCCDKVFDYPIEKTILRFDKGVLTGIYLTTKLFQKKYSESGQYTKWRPDDFESIKSSFSMLFGPPDSQESDETGAVTHIWASDKVILFSKYELLGTREGDRQQIVIANYASFRDEVKNGF